MKSGTQQEGAGCPPLRGAPDISCNISIVLLGADAPLYGGRPTPPFLVYLVATSTEVIAKRTRRGPSSLCRMKSSPRRLGRKSISSRAITKRLLPFWRWCARCSGRTWSASVRRNWGETPV